jgi:hypothetical protein
MESVERLGGQGGGEIQSVKKVAAASFIGWASPRARC